MLLYFHCISGAPELWMWGAIAISCWLIDWLIDWSIVVVVSDVTKFKFEFNDVRTSNVFTRFEIWRMYNAHMLVWVTKVHIILTALLITMRHFCNLCNIYVMSHGRHCVCVCVWQCVQLIVSDWLLTSRSEVWLTQQQNHGGSTDMEVTDLTGFQRDLTSLRHLAHSLRAAVPRVCTLRRTHNHLTHWPLGELHGNCTLHINQRCVKLLGKRVDSAVCCSKMWCEGSALWSR